LLRITSSRAATSNVAPSISARVARARSLSLADVLALVAEHTDGRAVGFLGEPGVNVLELDLALDGSPG